MKTKTGLLIKTRLLCYIAMVIFLLAVLAFTVFMPLGNSTASVTALVVARSLPAIVSQGQTFDVSITFTATQDDFMALVTDKAPTGWVTTVNSTWCTPTPSFVNRQATNKAEYIWFGPDSVGYDADIQSLDPVGYSTDTQFNVVYKVTVPIDASPGDYAFTGNVGYKISGRATIPVSIGGDSQVHIKFPPTVTTLDATDITTGTATLHGDLNSLGDYTTVNVSFEWGTVSGALDRQTTPNTSAPVAFSTALTGLTSNTYYYFRAKATSDGVTVYGDELNFTTAKIPPIVTTSSTTDITTSSVNLHGNLSSLGDYTTVNVSFEWGTVSGALDHQTTPNTSAPVSFSAALTGLTSNTHYYFRAKATSSVTVYGDELSFTTLKAPPKVTTSDATDITISSVNLHGNLSSLGDYTTVNVSFEWGTVSGALDHQTTPNTSAPVSFSAALTGLTSNTRYYFRAKATSSVTVYGDELSFTTLKAPPKVTTSDATDITMNSVNLHGNLSGLGDYTAVNVSFEWGTVSGALDHQTTPNISAPVAFSAALTGLTSNTHYYFRAKATSSVTVYGDELSFATAKIPPTVTTSSASDITTSTATLHGNLAGLGDYTMVNVSFEWWTDPQNKSETTLQTKTLAAKDFSATLTGLISNTHYYFRAKAFGNVFVYGDIYSFTTIDVTRQVPPKVLIGKTFNVTIIFTTSVNQFGQIEVIDESPTGWAITVDKTLCTPAPDKTEVALETPNRVDFVWNGNYVAGTLFSVVYQVNVPADAPLKQYSFADGQLIFHIAGGATCMAKISDDNPTEVIPGYTLKGKTYQVNGDVLPYVTIELIKDGTEPIATTLSDSEGNFTIIATQAGDQTLRARIAGFKEASYTISIADLGQEYTFNFKGKQGIIPKAPDIWYVLDCAALWKYPPSDTDLDLDIWKVLDVAAAWKYPTQ